MGDTINFDYYYGIEAEQFSFYRVPRLLIKDERFKGLRKAELFGKVRSGQVRFLLGSTQKMGADKGAEINAAYFL